jgi:geranylgeranyl diphosphate synthase, type II
MTPVQDVPGTQPARAPVDEYPFALRDEVEDHLRRLRFSRHPLSHGLEEAMRYSLLTGGKRVRPVLALATARALGADHRGMLPLASAIELIHTFTLVHDDLPCMDDDDFRRGRPTAHRVFGDAVAVLAGDALLGEAFRLALETSGPPVRVLRSVGVIADAVAVDGAAGGQYIDITGAATDEDAILHMHRLKTGTLLRAGVDAVLALVAPPHDAAAALSRYAADLGVLFQIVDDLKDGVDRGRPSGSDERNGRRTLVTTGRAERAVALADRRMDRIVESLRDVPGDTGELLGIARFVRAGATPGRARVRPSRSRRAR